MKHKVLSYLFGGLLIFSVIFFVGYVEADCSHCGGLGGPNYDACMAGCDDVVDIDGGNLFDQDVVAVGDASKSKNKCKDGCCGVKLNTNFPIIGNCIGVKGGKVNETNAFPAMMGALTKIVMSLILVACFILIIYAGILWSADKPKEAKERLKRVAITILLLGFSGVILRLINPNFFS